MNKCFNCGKKSKVLIKCGKCGIKHCMHCMDVKKGMCYNCLNIEYNERYKRKIENYEANAAIGN